MEAKRCILCERALTSDNNSAEHIIPNAIGGRKKVVGLICRDCNSDSGSKWDAELARQLESLSLLLGITRQRGKVRAQTFQTYSGGSICVNADGTMVLGKPEIQETTTGTTTRLRIRAATKKQVRQALEELRNRKYPQLHGLNMDDLLSTAQDQSYYSSDPMKIPSDFGGTRSGRSLVKSAIALVYDAGIDPRQCDLALDYLLKDGKEACFGYYCDSDTDLIINRPSRLPFHCVYVRGCSEHSTLVGYIEFYSLWRVVLCLSESYTGSDFTHVYAVDPIKGEELDIEVKLDLSVSDIREAYDYKLYDEAAFFDAISIVLSMVREIDFARAKDRATQDALETAFAITGAKEGDILTDEQLWDFAGIIAAELVPFIVTNYADHFPEALQPRLFNGHQ